MLVSVRGIDELWPSLHFPYWYDHLDVLDVGLEVGVVEEKVDALLLGFSGALNFDWDLVSSCLAIPGVWFHTMPKYALLNEASPGPRYQRQVCDILPPRMPHDLIPILDMIFRP